MDEVRVINRIDSGTTPVEQVLAELERVSQLAPDATARSSKRWPMQLQRGALTLMDEAGTRIHHAVVPRNISATGCSLLIGQFVYGGVRCALSLRTVTGRGRSLGATVHRCRHVSGAMHELGIAFDAEVDPREFAIKTGDEYMFQTEHVDAGALHGTLVYIDAVAENQQLVQGQFKDSHLDVVFARSAQEAFQVIERGARFVIVDQDLPDIAGIDFIAFAQKMGFAEPMVLITSRGDRDLRGRALEAGAKEVLRRPVTDQVMLQAVAEYIAPGEPPPPEEDAAKLAAGRQQLVAALCDGATAAVKAGDADRARKLVKVINGVSAGFGFKALMDAAHALSPKLESDGGVAGHLPEVEALATKYQKAA